jgi:predicted MFS family arabinose efflux permease
VTADNVGFATVTAGYLAATTGESLLAPVFPQAGPDLGLGTGAAGATFAVLAAAVAVGGLAGGFVLARLGPRVGVLLALTLVAAGALGAAAAGGPAAFLAGQVALGSGSGLYFASGIRSAALLAGEGRRGLAMALFGVAFSGGLALAGGLAALGTAWGWRTSFVATAVLAAVVAAGLAFAWTPPTAPPRAAAAARRSRLRVALGPPLRVGGVGAVLQYGTASFVPLFAVHVWGLSPATAALVLTAARIASVPAKLLSGNASDGLGAIRIARRVGLLLALLGLWWTLVPGAGAAAWAAVAFVAFISGLAPVANVLALESFEEHAELLGAFRSAQIGLGAAASALLGAGVSAFGLRPSLIVAAVVVPATLLLRPRGEGVAEPQTTPGAPS